MRTLLNFWKHIPIWKKLYFVVGMMTFLIAVELFALRFAMRQLSAARAFVGGESTWSKAQKNAVFSLQRFGITREERDFQEFLNYLKIPEGDHIARIELQKADPDLAIVRQGFLEGRIHPEDIDPVIELLRKFYWVSYLAQAIEIWTKGDELLFELKESGHTYHLAVVQGDGLKAERVLNQIKRLNEELTVLEEDFSRVLGLGSRWLEQVILMILTLAVLSVETVGLTITFYTSRGISRGLSELGSAAHRMGQGEFAHAVPVRSRDEIGQVGQAINKMGLLLRQSYGDLETKVQERTSELKKMAEENARLYEEAKKAVESRDEFLSIASHELKTPLTALYLQLQRLARFSEDPSFKGAGQDIAGMAHTSMNLSRKITNLLNELLDLTRLQIGKIVLRKEPCELVQLIQDVVSQLTPESNRAGSGVHLKGSEPVLAFVDRLRLTQVITNLLSNAIKYGNGKPIEITVDSENGAPVIRVKDQGKGIPPNLHQKIFNRFDRGQADSGISGLGLGLYITHEIVKAHGGTITVESRINEGSVFTVRMLSEARAA
jgi:two-component system, sensor histidine kinase